MPEPKYRAEQEVIGSLEPLDEPAMSAVLEPASGHTSREVLEIIHRLRADAPDDPFWKGIAEVAERAGAVAIRFHDGIEPRDVESGDSRLQCHLYDPEALAAAEAVRGESRSDDGPSPDRGTLK
jgi:hypothetical protein